MHFEQILKTTLNGERNPVNRMYLNEIILKWSLLERNIPESLEDEASKSQFTKAFNDFSTQLKTAKYRYNEETKNGFQADSIIFRGLYLEDLIDHLMKKHLSEEMKGVIWGRSYYTMKTHFTGFNIKTMLTKPEIQSRPSKEYLMLGLDMDISYRVALRKNYQRKSTIFPLIIFYTTVQLQAKQMMELEYDWRQAKKENESVKLIVVCETVANDVCLQAKETVIDSIFILRKQNSTEANIPITEDVVAKLDSTLTQYINEPQDVSLAIVKQGYKA